LPLISTTIVRSSSNSHSSRRMYARHDRSPGIGTAISTKWRLVHVKQYKYLIIDLFHAVMRQNPDAGIPSTFFNFHEEYLLLLVLLLLYIGCAILTGCKWNRCKWNKHTSDHVRQAPRMQRDEPDFTSTCCKSAQCTYVRSLLRRLQNPKKFYIYLSFYFSLWKSLKEILC
jgi:hypothetical protein